MKRLTPIQWTGRTWNPLRARLKRDVTITLKGGGTKTFSAGTMGWFCTKCSPGCAHCYAEKINLRLGNGLTYQVQNLDEIEFVLVKLDAPQRWKNGGMVFVNSMTDLFHESLHPEMIDIVFAAMANAPQCTFQVLTKRAKRMQEYMTSAHRLDRILDQWARVSDRPRRVAAWPLPNVWLGTSTENHACANERIPPLLATPAAVRFLSVEPLLGAVEFSDVTNRSDCFAALGKPALNGIHWVIVGGESGSQARQCKVEWVRSVVRQCAVVGVPCFVKQLGGNLSDFDLDHCTAHSGRTMHDKKGGDPSEWPEYLRVREFPGEKSEVLRQAQDDRVSTRR